MILVHSKIVYRTQKNNMLIYILRGLYSTKNWDHDNVTELGIFLKPRKQSRVFPWLCFIPTYDMYMVVYV